jgi:hypothetical protein
MRAGPGYFGGPEWAPYDNPEKTRIVAADLRITAQFLITQGHASGARRTRAMVALGIP